MKELYYIYSTIVSPANQCVFELVKKVILSAFLHSS